MVPRHTNLISFRFIGERMQMLCLNMNISYLDLWNDFIGSLKLYKKDEVHLNDKGGSIFATKMDEFFSVWQETKW